MPLGQKCPGANSRPPKSEARSSGFFRTKPIKQALVLRFAFLAKLFPPRLLLFEILVQLRAIVQIERDCAVDLLER